MIEQLPFRPDTIAVLQAEMNRAIRKHGIENTPLRQTDHVNLAVLVEEVGEVARAMTYDEGSDASLYDELVQVAAMALAFAQNVDGRLP